VRREDIIRGVRRFWQLLFGTLSVMSLLLCLATLGLWERSLHTNTYGRSHGNHRTYRYRYGFDSDGLTFEWYSYSPVPIQGPNVSDANAASLFGQRFSPLNFHEKFRFRWGSGSSIGTAPNGVLWNVGSTWWIKVPPWALVAFFGGLWWLFLRWARRKGSRRYETGRCINCGYDLRATPERCPECGTVPEQSHPTAPGQPGELRSPAK
jgi:hypothetical protein